MKIVQFPIEFSNFIDEYKGVVFGQVTELTVIR